MLFLAILSETKTLMLQAVNLLHKQMGAMLEKMSDGK